MTGLVTDVDPATGALRLQTAEAGTLDLRVPPSALAGVREGDRVTVEIGANPVR